MMWHTHAAIGASSVWLLVPIAHTGDSSLLAVLTVLAVIGALVPDLDAVESKIKHVRIAGIKPLMPVAQAINQQFGHRGLLHSLRGWALWTLLVLPISAWVGVVPILALSLGYASHLAADACTVSGIPLLYPQKRRYFLLPLRLRIVTGSDVEEVFFAAFACMSLILLMKNLP